MPKDILLPEYKRFQCVMTTLMVGSIKGSDMFTLNYFEFDNVALSLWELTKTLAL